MLITSTGDAIFPDGRGRTFNFNLDHHVTRLSLGFLNVPEVGSGRIRVELNLLLTDGHVVRSLPRWAQSSRSQTPARLISLERQSGDFQLPSVALPDNLNSDFSVQLQARKRDLSAMKKSGTKFYVTAEASAQGLRNTTIRRVA